MEYRLMSYKNSTNMPIWPGIDGLSLSHISDLSEGGFSNIWEYKIINHIGTHMDAPNHYRINGEQLCNLPLDRFVYDHPLVLDVPKGLLEKITKADLEPYADKIAECDLLIFRTGQYKMHSTDMENYSHNGAAVSAEAAEYLVKNFPNIKSVMMDFLSLSTPSDPDDGNLAHQWLLGTWTDNFICIIEDADLSNVDGDRLKKVIGLPLMVEGIDSCQLTVMGIYED